MDEPDAPPPDDVPAVSAEDLVAGDERRPARRQPARLYPSTLGGLLFLMVLAALAAGIALVVLVDWRLGTRVVGATLISAAVFRLLLPERMAGMLAVRVRWLDAMWLIGAGTVLIILAGSIPNQPGG